MRVLTLTLESLVYEAVQQGAAVVAEGGAGVGVHAEPVLGAVVLKIGVRMRTWQKTQAQSTD
jgi:hypothetical protein